MQKFLNHIVEVLEQQGLTDVRSLLTIPTEAGRGDVALPCFVLAKPRPKSPEGDIVAGPPTSQTPAEAGAGLWRGQTPLEIAQEIASKIKPDQVIERVEAVGPFVNFFIKDEVLGKLALEQAGKVTADRKSSEPVMVEFFLAQLKDGKHGGGKWLMKLDLVQLVKGKSGAIQSFIDGERRAYSHVNRIIAVETPGADNHRDREF